MAKKNGREKSKQKNNKPKNPLRELKRETRGSIYGVLFIMLAIVLALSAFRQAGPFGVYLYEGVYFLVGLAFYILPLIFLFIAVTLFRDSERKLGAPRVTGILLFLFSGLSLLELLAPLHGGIIGEGIARGMVMVIDLYATFIVLISILIISLLITFDKQLHLGLIDSLRHVLGRKKTVPDATGLSAETIQKKAPEEAYDDEEEEDAEDEQEEPIEPPAEKSFGIGTLFNKKEAQRENEGQVGLPPTYGDYNPPPLSLLERDRGKPTVGDTKANANIIKRTLQNFGIRVEMDEITVGPTVTRYALKPAEGVRLAKIIGLHSNLELALAASPIRIEAPIPGRSLVGIEVPNSVKSIIGLGSMLASTDFTESQKPLMVALGKDITGTSVFGDMAKMPHALVAGQTGSGKSVAIHSILTSLLYRNGPARLRFILIDPKRVELTLYKNIPHLITPVITDPKKAILALKWAGKEMNRRYDVFEENQVRDIASYHLNILAPAEKEYAAQIKAGASEDELDIPEQMPHIVVVIDELADIMQAYPRELEASIVRLAQMSRAVGIHLLLSTQRPSVNVITGLIKANVPTRIALQVASQIDSRTILDTSGAEKLLGQGDMLYLSGDMAKPRRLQSAFISEAEVKKVVSYIKKNNDTGLDSVLDLTNEENAQGGVAIGNFDDDDNDDDTLYEEARKIVMSTGKASTSYLQRRLRIGYARGARLMDLLEERGVVGPGDGGKPRDVLQRSEDATDNNHDRGASDDEEYEE